MNAMMIYNVIIWTRSHVLTLVTREKSGKTRISTKAFSPIKVVVWIVLLDETPITHRSIVTIYLQGTTDMERCVKKIRIHWLVLWSVRSSVAFEVRSNQLYYSNHSYRSF